MASLLARLFAPRVTTPSPRVATDDEEARDAHFDERSVLVLERYCEAQRDEYRPHLRELLDATLTLDEGRFEEARSLFEARLARTPEARFLLRDVGRARLACGDAAGAHSALTAFLQRTADVIPSELRFETHLDLVRVAEEGDDVERVFEALSAMVEDMPDDPRPMFLLARALRVHGHPAEALEVWSAQRTNDPSSEMLEEFGLCQLSLGRLAEAEGALEEVVRRAKCRCGARVPEATTLALVAIYERTGRASAARELRESTERASACGT